MAKVPTSDTGTASNGIMVRMRGTSRNQAQASAAVTKGPVAMMIATLDTLVSCRDGMKAIMADADNDAISQPLFLILIRSRRPVRPCSISMIATIMALANNPRQKRMVQES